MKLTPRGERVLWVAIVLAIVLAFVFVGALTNSTGTNPETGL